MLDIPEIKIQTGQITSELCRHGAEFQSDKSPLNNGKYRHAYTPIYQMLFSSFRNEPIAMAEIGIAFGNSLQMFRKFFPNAWIYGMDKKMKFIEYCTMLELEKVKLMQVDAKDREELTNCFSKIQHKFDLIIDDSSHQLGVQKNIIDNCLSFLNPGGILIIEDVPYTPNNRYEIQLSEIVSKSRSMISFCSFVVPIDDRSFTGHWKNERFLLIYRNEKEI